MSSENINKITNKRNKFILLVILVILLLLFFVWFFHTPPDREGIPCEDMGRRHAWGPCGIISGESPFRILMKSFKPDEQIVF